MKQYLGFLSDKPRVYEAIPDVLSKPEVGANPWQTRDLPVITREKKHGLKK